MPLNSKLGPSPSSYGCVDARMDTWMNGWQTAGAGLEACGDWFMLADEWCECTPQGTDAGAAAALEGSQASTETARSRGSVVKSVRILRPGMSLSVKEGTRFNWDGNQKILSHNQLVAWQFL